LSEAGSRVCVLDDLANRDLLAADLVVNPTPGAEDWPYTLQEGATLLAGPSYALLNATFPKVRVESIGRERGLDRVLICIGGKDGTGATGAVVEIVKRALPSAALRVVVADQATGARGDRVQLHPPQRPREMVRLMAWADLAVATPSTLAWELACLGVPAVLVQVAANQTPIVRALREADLAQVCTGLDQLPAALEAYIALPAAARRQRVVRWAEVTDGRGAGRVAVALEQLGDVAPDGADRRLLLRWACIDDSRLLWEWVNEPAVRQSAFNQALIPYDQHVEWFTRKLADQSCQIFVALDTSWDPIGQIRFERCAGQIEVDVSIAQTSRGRGFGSLIIREGVARLAQEIADPLVHAYVKITNTPSVVAFERAGFSRQGVERLQGEEAVHLIWRGLAV